MSKVNVNHEEHASPAEVDELIQSILDPEEHTSPRDSIVHLRRYRQILLDAYLVSLHAADPDFWDGKPRYLKKGTLA